MKDFNLFEKILWITSVVLIAILFFINSEKDYFSFAASFIGVTALIFLAKGNVLGQFLTIVFALLYGYISWKFKYYGEMITYIFMTAPVALFTAIQWLRHPYSKDKNEVEIADITIKNFGVIFLLSVVVTFVFYFILKYFGTANLIISTVSIFTSFMASALMFMRSHYYAVAYCSNDVVLIIMWVMATVENLQYMPMVLCFLIFFINDIYGYLNWKKIRTLQREF